MEKLLTAKQVSELLEVKVSTVYDWASQGTIPYVKLGRLIRFKKPEVFRWVESHTTHPRSSATKKKGIVSRPAAVQKEFSL